MASDNKEKKSELEGDGGKWKFMDEFWFEVSFLLQAECVGPEVAAVYLAGDFNQWKLLDSYLMKPCQEGYGITVPLSQGYYHYKFVLLVPSGGNGLKSSVEAESKATNSDSKSEAENDMKNSGLLTSAKQIWIKDPRCPYVGGRFGNSIMFVHMDPGVYGIRSQNTPHRDYQRPGSDGSEFQTFCPSLPSDIEALGVLQRLIFVYLPPSYNRDRARHYPVLYANDGQTLFSTPEHAGGPYRGGYYMDEKLDYFWDQELLPEFILVGVPNSDFVCLGNRTLEYCTSEFHNTSKDPYKRYLVEVVKKEVDAKYRTMPDGRHSLIMGGSMGGLCAFVLSLNHPDVFSSAVCFSSSFWYVDKYNVSTFDLLRSRSGRSSTSEVDGNTCLKAMDQCEVCSSISMGSKKVVRVSNSFCGTEEAHTENAPKIDLLPPSCLASSADSLPTNDANIFATPPDLRSKIYIDSGDGPGDNSFETKEMNETFLQCGWKEGEEFMYVFDKCAEKTEDGVTHLECMWKERMLPALQFAFDFKPNN